MMDWALWRSLANSKTEEKPTSSVSERRARYVGALATVGNFVPTGWKKEKEKI
jgi:hypothetical protein